jgi:hypothetical protein
MLGVGPEPGRPVYTKTCVECDEPFVVKFPSRSGKTCSEACRRKLRRRVAEKVRKADCHPDRKHHAKGLCRPCYKTARSRAEYVPKARRQPRKPECGHDRPHKGRGLCDRCYDKRHVSSRSARCHPDRPHHAKGLCEPCYRGQQNRARDRRLAAGGHHTEEEWRRLLALYTGCPRCRRPWAEAGAPTRDHVVSVRDGGDDSIGNIQPLCLSCNSQKQRRSERYPIY